MVVGATINGTVLLNWADAEQANRRMEAARIGNGWATPWANSQGNLRANLLSLSGSRPSVLEPASEIGTDELLYAFPAGETQPQAAAIPLEVHAEVEEGTA